MFMEGLRKLEYKKYKPRLVGGKVGSGLRAGHFCFLLKKGMHWLSQGFKIGLDKKN